VLVSNLWRLFAAFVVIYFLKEIFSIIEEEFCPFL